MLDILKKEKNVKRYKDLNNSGSFKESQMERICCSIWMVIIFCDLRDKGALVRKALTNNGIRSSLKT